MRIAGLITGGVDYPRAIHIYRLTLPLSYINQRTRHQAGWTDTNNAAFRLTEQQMNWLLGSDIIVMGRPITKKEREAADYVKLLRTAGAKVVYETDDDLTNVYRDTSNGTGASCIPYLNLVDAITVSTPGLASALRKFTNKPIYVCRNVVEPAMWNTVTDNTRRIYSETFNVMLVGTATHSNDWEPAYRAIKAVMEKRANIQLLVGGFKPDYVQSGDRVVVLPYVHYKNYPAMLKQADVVVCAVDNQDRFNDSKSAVKAIEAWAARRKVGHRLGGAAVIATDSSVYNDTVAHERNGLLVAHSFDGYYNALERLIQDTRLRERLQVTGNADVLKKHSIFTGYQQWVSAYKQIIKEK